MCFTTEIIWLQIILVVYSGLGIRPSVDEINTARQLSPSPPAVL